MSYRGFLSWLLLVTIFGLLFYPAHANARSTGTIQTLVIMVDFNDVPFTYTPDSFQSLFFSCGTKSVVDYYYEVSYSQLNIGGR